MKLFKWIICVKIALCMGCAHLPIQRRTLEPEEHYFNRLTITGNAIFVTVDVPENTEVRVVFGEDSNRFSNMSESVSSGVDKVIGVTGLRPCTLYYMQILFHSGRVTKVSKVLEIRTAPPDFAAGEKPLACSQR